MKLRITNDYKLNPRIGRVFNLITIGYINIPGMRPQITFAVLGIGLTLSWSKR